MLYRDLEAMVGSASSGEPVVVMGDFHARVGRRRGDGEAGLCSASDAFWDGTCE